VDTTTTFRVIVSDSCGLDTLFLQLNVFHEVITVSSDTSMCVSNSYQLSASGGTNYQWSPATYLDDPNIANPVTSPDSSITYNVLISTANACQFTKQVFVSVFYGLPVPVMDDTVLHCRYASSNVAVSGATGYEWFPYEYISSNTSQNVNIYSPISQYYNCAFTNSCGTVWDSIYVQVQHPTVLSSPNVTVCLGEQAQLSASGAATYNWYPAYLVDDPNSDTVMATVVLPIQMIIVGSDILGCIDSATITLNVFPSANVNAYKLLTAEIGDALLLEAKGNSMNGTYEWSPDFALSCVFCQSTLASPNENTIYEVVFTDTNGCIARDQIKIVYEPIIFVPNTFTPNSDGKNELFRVEAYNIRTFYLEIFNRWGELIHTMDTKNNGWNGQFKGETCPQGLYTWKLSYNDFNEQPEIKVGHLMILR
jgi:gliding motility-associated-like protein